MSILDIFNNNAFAVTTMSDAMREIKHVPGLIGSMGLFMTSSVSTLSIAIEKDKDQNLILVPASPRGGVGITFGKNKRSMRSLTIPHFEVNDAIYADEVQGVRAFGTEQAVETLQSRIADRAAEASTFFSLTEEFHRLKVLTTGILYDSDGTTPLFNYMTEFGESLPTELDFDLDNATPAEGALRKFCADVHRKMADALGGLPFTGITALCGNAFFDDLIAHKEVRDTYKNYEAASMLRQAYVNGAGQSVSYGEFTVFGIRFINYRGSFNGAAAVNTDKAHQFPTGVPGLFRTVYGPADYIETVNRPGQRLYAKQYEMQNGKGVHLDFQSNVINYVTRPRVLFRAKRT